MAKQLLTCRHRLQQYKLLNSRLLCCMLCHCLQTKWEETEDKPAALAVTFGALLLLVAASSVVDAVDKIPIVSDLIELIGVVVTGW